MATATRTKRRTAAPQTFPPPSGCAEYETALWLIGLPDDLPWLTELRETHVKLAQEWAAAVDRIADARDAYTAQEASYRTAVRDALASSLPAPERPAGLDPAARDAAVAIALEDAQEARDNLNEHVLLCLATLREHRSELRPETLSSGLLVALSSGAPDARQITAERARRTIVAGVVEEVSDAPLAHVGEEPV